MRTSLISLLSLAINLLCAQNFETDPSNAKFITSDVRAFWEAFDKMENDKKAFKEYIENGSQGVKDFVPYRIESAKNLYKVATKKRTDYEKIRAGSYEIDGQKDQIRKCYQELKNIYADAVFPPTYFVIGAFNSGGTSTKNGLIIGVEMQSEIDNVPYIVAHELIHFNQKFPKEPTLLTQSINEGAADLIGEMISGKHINMTAMTYFNANEEELCQEFVGIMSDTKYHGWLYGGGGKKEGRPNDLGYSIGYKIAQAYYDKSDDKTAAIAEILNIADFNIFMKKSGYLEKYMN